LKTTTSTFDGGRPAVATWGDTTIFDFGFRPLLPEGRAENINAGAAAPLVIGDDTFAGMDALVRKGVTIGEGAVVGAGSVVTQDVPPRTVAAGDPAQVAREL
jgi:acetyltransferase-like isoleucine patch superfamily enzyme